MSVRVVAVITAKPGSEDAVRSALVNLVPPTRAEEGNIAYSLTESSASPGVFVTLEEWRDPSDLDAHLQTEHIAAALGAVGEHLAAPPAIHPLSPIDVE